MNKLPPWICPICRMKHPEPVVLCKRCGCQLMLLKKIEEESKRLERDGDFVKSRHLFQDLS